MIGSISEGKYSCVFRSIKDIGYFSGDGGERSLSLAGFAREILRMMRVETRRAMARPEERRRRG